MSRRVRSKGRDEDGLRLRLRFRREEHRVLCEIPRQLREILTDPDRASPLICRLFPPAHDDPAAQKEHEDLLGDMLFERRRENLRIFEDCLHRQGSGGRHVEIELNEPEIDLWLHVLNDMRILLGLRLGISSNEWFREVPRDPQSAFDHQMLGALSLLQEDILEAIADSEPQDE